MVRGPCGIIEIAALYVYVYGRSPYFNLDCCDNKQSSWAILLVGYLISWSLFRREI